MGAHDVSRVCRACGRKFPSNKLSPDTEDGWTCLGCWTKANPDVLASLLGGGELLGPAAEPITEMTDFFQEDVPSDLFLADALLRAEGAK